MILLCGAISDEVTAYMQAQLEATGDEFRFIDLNTYPAGYRVAWHWRAGRPSGYVATDDWSVDLGGLSGVFIRYPGPEDPRASSELPSGQARATADEALLGLSALVDELPCAVVNRQAAGLSNSSKLYQAQIIKRSGLRTPPTLVTTDPAAASQFYAACQGEVVYKPLSSWPSVVRRFEPAQLGRLRLLRHAPVQFQALIPGQEVRVHTVGYNQVFATFVRSNTVDYRCALDKPGGSLEMEPASVPAAVGEACLAVARKLGLLFSGIDLRATPENEWYCFEVNPSPGFTFFESRTRQPIALALVHLLRAGWPSDGEDCR